MPNTNPSFEILGQVDSTNNYAMGKVHAGMAKHGDAYFSSLQTDGKGQRGRVWLTEEGQGIALSVVLKPKQLNILKPFQLSVAVALATFDFFSCYAGYETFIKWPNDIYWRDRKAGGILIENKFIGKDWKSAVAGVGINVNEANFDERLINPVSLKQITEKNFDLVILAQKLHACIFKRAGELIIKPFEIILSEYNQHLYKIHTPVRLKKGNMVFETTIKGVSEQGQLLTIDSIERCFEFGQVEWVID